MQDAYTIQPVPWDSRFFGFPVGNIQLPDHFSQARLKDALAQVAGQFRLVYVNVAEEGPDELEELAVPTKCYDRKVVFERDVPAQVADVDPHIQAHTDMTCPRRLEMLAVQSGTFSRFLKDPKLSPYYERLFLTWVNQSVSGQTADAIWVWVADDDTKAGLITTRLFKGVDPETGKPTKEGRIGLLSVDQAYRGRGAAFALMGACDYWAHSLDVPKLSLSTQKENDVVMRLCQKCGYTQVTELTTYHYWTPGWKYSPHQGWHLRGQ